MSKQEIYKSRNFVYRSVLQSLLRNILLPFLLVQEFMQYMQSIEIIGASHLLEVEFDLVSCVDMFSIIISIEKNEKVWNF